MSTADHHKHINNGQELTGLVGQHLEQSRSLHLRPLIAVIGPTASGKTALGIALARQFNGEIISADSRQIYQQMNIGAAVPTKAEQSAAKHHLIDFLDPAQPFTLADYQKLAAQTIDQIFQSGHQPIIVGGTGLYISAITQNYQLPDSKPNLILRQQYEKMAMEQGNEAVHQILQNLAPEVASKIHPNNLRYVIRAIEIAEASGLTVDTLPAAPIAASKGLPAYHTLFIQIDWPRDQLYQRIERRIDQQIAAGMVEETASLLRQYGRQLPALTSLGYQEIADYLDGRQSLEKSLEIFKKNTRNFAKRQLTWFRKYPQVYSILGTKLSQLIVSFDPD